MAASRGDWGGARGWQTLAAGRMQVEMTEMPAAGQPTDPPVISNFTNPQFRNSGASRMQPITLHVATRFDPSQPNKHSSTVAPPTLMASVTFQTSLDSLAKSGVPHPVAASHPGAAGNP